jgi:diguanylate cyclase (GGDEF)-like protein/PAS domain S-box-containing protein
MAAATPSTDQRLALILETQREILGAGETLDAAAALIAQRAQAITAADGAMVNLIAEDQLHTVGASGSASGALGARRPIGSSVARCAISERRSVLVTDSPNDPRIDQQMRAIVGDTSLICVPLLHGDGALGTLNLMRSDPAHPLGQDDIETLEMLSVVLTAALARASESDARRAQAEAVARFRTLFDSASIGILRMDCKGKVMEANPAMQAILGRTLGELVDGRFAAHVAGKDRGRLEAMFATLTSAAEALPGVELRCKHSSGAAIWVLMRAILEPGAGGKHGSVVAMVEDISARKRAELELQRQAEINQHQALHDQLTGLPNRTLFGERIGQAILRARRQRTKLAVALIDIDRFKDINDSLGHGVGDKLLVRVGELMAGALRASDTVARLGGDEFGLVLPELATTDALTPVLGRLQAALDQPIQLEDLPIGIELSIGIALYPDHGTEAQTLIRRADVAMYEAKRSGLTHAFYDAASQAYDVANLTLVAELRRALAEHELVLHYQPKAALESGEVASVEALVRWAHPHRGLLAPDTFIPLAQETSLIGPLTLFVIEEALHQIGAWRKEGVELRVAVNLSTRNLLDRDLPNQVAALLARCGVAGEMLELEVTETAMLANPTRAREVLEELSRLGIRLSIDDFGTGYSSLAYLRELPVDEIKIDRSFVTGMVEHAGDAVIVRSTVDLGRNLGLEVVAEGVETAEHWRQLRELGCDTAQGYYLSQPMPGSEMRGWLRRWRRKVAPGRGARRTPVPAA